MKLSVAFFWFQAHSYEVYNNNFLMKYQDKSILKQIIKDLLFKFSHEYLKEIKRIEKFLKEFNF